MDKQLTETLALDASQAHSLSQALDTVTRLGIGQMDCIEHLVRGELLLGKAREGFAAVDFDTCDRVKLLMGQFQNHLGFPTNGSFGIHNKRVPMLARRCWELKKILDKALAENANPNPSFRGVNYDGLIVRNTNDVPPEVKLFATLEDNQSVLESVNLYLTLDQKEAVHRAAEILAALNANRFQVLAELVEEGQIPMNDKPEYPLGDAEAFQAVCQSLTQVMDYRLPAKGDTADKRGRVPLSLESLVRAQAAHSSRNK